MRKFILGLAFAVVCILSFGISSWAAEQPLQYEDFTYEVITKEDVDQISIKEYTGDDTEVTVPKEIDGKPVTEIGESAFRALNITKIYLPEGINNIQSSSFEFCTKLSAISIPSTLRVINNRAFFGCEMLAAVNLPDGLKTIGNQAFSECENLKSIAIPATVQSIGENAFAGSKILECGLIICPSDLDVYASVDENHINDFTCLFYSTDEDNKKIVINAIQGGGNLDYWEESQIDVPDYIGGYLTEISQEVLSEIENHEKTVNTTHSHAGGIATCEKKAVCVICEQEYGELGSHVFSDEWITDGVHHWNECTVCKGKRNYAEHSGGTLTCTEQAECIMCGEKYGTPTHHYSSGWITDGAYHWHECTACGDRKDISAHDFKTTTYKATPASDGRIETGCTVCDKLTKLIPIYAATNISLAKESVAYNKKVQKPKVIVKDSKGNVIDKAHYSITLPKGLKKVGNYKVKLTFKGNMYEGSKDLNLKINPVKTKLTSAKAGTKSIKLKWTRKTAEVTGYEICYALKKDYKGARRVVVKSAKTATKEINKLKPKKTYYVRIRTYKSVKGKKFYSGWSATKKVKIK